MAQMIGSIQGAHVTLGAEVTEGSVDASDARALDVSGISPLYDLRVLRASYNAATTALKQGSYDAQETSAKGGIPPVVVQGAIGNDGNPVRSPKGELSIDMILRGFGANAPLSTGLGLLLASGLDYVAQTPGTTRTAIATGDNTFTVASGAALLHTGDVIAVPQADGRMLFCRITNTVAGVPTAFTVLESHGYGNGDTFTIRLCHMFYPPASGTPDGASLAVQLRESDTAFCRLGVGARLSGLGIKLGQAKEPVLTVKLSCTDGDYGSSAFLTAGTPLPSGVTGTTPMRALVSPLTISEDHSADAAPWSGTASALHARDWSVDVANSLYAIPDQGTRSGTSGQVVSTSIAAGTFTQLGMTNMVDMREVMRESQSRAIGLTAAGANDAGNGMCFYVGCLSPKEDPGVATTDTDRTQTVAFQAGNYLGDAGNAVTSGQPWILAFVC